MAINMKVLKIYSNNDLELLNKEFNDNAIPLTPKYVGLKYGTSLLSPSYSELINYISDKTIDLKIFILKDFFHIIMLAIIGKASNFKLELVYEDETLKEETSVKINQITSTYKKTKDIKELKKNLELTLMSLFKNKNNFKYLYFEKPEDNFINDITIYNNGNIASTFFSNWFFNFWEEILCGK